MNGNDKRIYDNIVSRCKWLCNKKSILEGDVETFITYNSKVLQQGSVNVCLKYFELDGPRLAKDDYRATMNDAVGEAWSTIKPSILRFIKERKKAKPKEAEVSPYEKLEALEKRKEELKAELKKVKEDIIVVKMEIEQMVN